MTDDFHTWGVMVTEDAIRYNFDGAGINTNLSQNCRCGPAQPENAPAAHGSGTGAKFDF